LLTFEAYLKIMLVRLQYTLSIVLSLWFTTTLGQNKSTSVQDDCITVQEIKIPFDGNQFTSSDNGPEKPNYNIVYYADIDEYTFWYKLIITTNCKMKFAVMSATPGDDYDFMLYKFNANNFCEALVDSTLVPLNDVIYTSDYSQSDSTKQDLFMTSQNEIDVKAGEIYYLSIMNLYGEDCGHRLHIDACGKSIAINSVHKPCFQFSEPKITTPLEEKEDSNKIDSLEKLDENNADSTIVDNYVKINGKVYDNDNGTAISATITFIDEVNGDEFVTSSSEISGYEIALERGRRYQVKCKAFGYYEIKGNIEFLKPSVYDYYLLKIKEGKTFVMEHILFHPSTYALKDNSFSELDILVSYMNNNPNMKIQIEGHTAGNAPVSETNPAYKHLDDQWNFTGTAKKLSKLRAETVKKYLIQKGINSSRVLSTGYGASQKLITKPKSKEENALNMRVEVKIIMSGEAKDYNIEPRSPLE
jgi:outer membrane protein OmpA-like peptidoglycan-associated protein